MKGKIITAIICLFFAISLTAPMVSGASSDTFAVTASGAYLEIQILNASWAIGTVAMSTSYWTNETSETLLALTYNSTGGTNLDYEMAITGEATTWFTVWAENMSTGADQYKINASNDTWVALDTALNFTTYTDVDADFDPTDNVTFDLRFDTPTSTTTGVTQTVTLTGKVTVH